LRVGVHGINILRYTIQITDYELSEKIIKEKNLNK
jgi:hypothetical protein